MAYWTSIPNILISPHGGWHINLATPLQTNAQNDSILHRLRRPLGRCGKERVRSVAEERDSAVVAYPSRKGVSVYQFPVDD